MLQATTSALTSRDASSSSASIEKRADLRVGADAVRRAGVVAEVDRRLVGRPAEDLAQDGQSTDARVEDTDRPGVGHVLEATAESPSPPLGPPARRRSADVLADLGGRVGEHERDALVVRAHDEPAARAHGVLRHAPERPGEGLGVEAARRVGAVHEVADLGRRVADHPERVRHHHRAVDRRRVVGHDLEDRVRRVEEQEVDVVDDGRGVDDDHVVDAAQQRHRLVEVADGDHLRHLDARRREQDVDPGRVAPQHVLEVRLLDPVRRQVEQRRRVDRHLEQRPQVAELEAAVDEDGARAELAERDREVEREGRLADAALGREHRDHPGRAGGIADRRVLVDLLEPVDELVARERHRQHAVDPLPDVDRDRLLRDRQHDDGDARARLVELVDERHALDPALQERVHEHDVGPQLRHQTGDPRPVGDDVEQLDRRLRVEQPADVLRDLGDVLDDEESDLIRHRADSTTRSGPRRPAPKVPPDPAARGMAGGCAAAMTRGQGRRATSTTRSAPELERAEVVVAGERLHHEAGGLGEPDQLVGPHESQPVDPDPADGRPVAAPRPRRSWSGGRRRSTGRRRRSRSWSRCDPSPGPRGPTRGPGGRRSGRGRPRRAARRRPPRARPARDGRRASRRPRPARGACPSGRSS